MSWEVLYLLWFVVTLACYFGVLVFAIWRSAFIVGGLVAAFALLLSMGLLRHVIDQPLWSLTWVYMLLVPFCLATICWGVFVQLARLLGHSRPPLDEAAE